MSEIVFLESLNCLEDGLDVFGETDGQDRVH